MLSERSGVKRAFMFTLFVATASCVSLSEGGYDYDAGWRSATVLAVGRADEIKGRTSLDCRSSVYDESQQFAYLRYNHIPYKLHRAIVPVPEGWRLSVGDRAYVNINDCAETVVRLNKSR